jgi:hypothetical protein
LPRPWDTADTHYTAPLDNGLSLPWFGRIWLNPPYGDEAGAWLQPLTLSGIDPGVLIGIDSGGAEL